MPRCRPFKLIDAMILTAAAAVGMARMRPLWNELQMAGMASRKGIPWQAYAGTVQTGLNIALLMLAVAYLVIRLIPPRPSRSDLIRQPGMLLLGVLIGLSILLMALSAFVPLVAETNMIIALALGLSWRAACRRYRPRAEPGWIEGLGRSVGVGLVVSTAAIYPLYLLAS
jgi:multisubunit Na+/H+ antiporter MnhB subunit